MKSHLQISTALALIVILTACDSSNSENSLADGLMSTSVPENLRSIPANDLSAGITLNGNTTTYHGSAFPDGVWHIPLDIESNQTYELVVRWFAYDHILMEESGTIFSDSENPIIKPDLDFVTIGDDRFDTDCDGISNLVEIKLGSDPGRDSLAPCNEPVVIEDPTAQMLPWLAQNFQAYAAITGATERMTSVEQSVFIRETGATEASFYSMVFNSDDTITRPDGSQINLRATLQLIKDPIDGDVLSFFTPQAIGVNSGNENVTCSTDNQLSIYCSLPFEVSTQQWYSLRLVEDAPSQWQGWIDDQVSGESVLIATIEMPPQTTWRGHAVDVGYGRQVTAQTCAQGLDKISIRFKDAVVNGGYTNSVIAINRSTCIDLGVQSTVSSWSGGSKLIDGEMLYSLTIGN